MAGADIGLKTFQSSNNTALTIPGYTKDLEHKTNIKLLIALHEESVKLQADPEPDLAKYPHWAERGPALIGYFPEIAEMTSSRVQVDLFASHPLPNALIRAIVLREDLRRVAAEVVLYGPLIRTYMAKGRETTQYGLFSPGLAVNDETRLLFNKRIRPETQIRFLKTAIIYHAQLRIQLAFYLFIAYYKTRIHLNLNDTRIQEGTGDSAINTVACHSALISSITETHRWKEGVEVNKLIKETRSNSEPLNKVHLHLKSSFLNSVAAITVELTSSVNQYDAQLEGKTTIGGAKPGRLLLLDLLRKVSLGDLNPLQALEQFLINLISEDGVLDKVRTSGYLNKGCATSPQEVRPIIHRYIFLATLMHLKKMADGKLHVNREYAASLLFMKPADRAIIANCGEALLASTCEPYFMRLQTEITENVL